MSPTPGLPERIDQTDAEWLESLRIAGGNGQIMGQGGRRDQRIFKVVIRPSMHQACPAAEDRGICRNDILRCKQLIQPGLNFVSFGRFLSPGFLLRSNCPLSWAFCLSIEHVGMTKKKIPSPHEFILSMPLYSETAFAGEQVWEILDLVYFSGTYDSFCTKCGRDSTFQVDPPPRPSDFKRNHAREQLIRRQDGTPEFPALDPCIHRVQAKCTRHNAHSQYFLFLIDHRLGADETGKRHKELIIQKVGQHPSFGDLHMQQVKKYASVLTKQQLGELNRAIGLASHDVGVGSYVYLRRVFEALIEEAHAHARANGEWDEDLYIRSRTSERISLLESHLPSFLVEHPKMYSLLSKGVHELSEDDCLSHFETLRIAIELILDEKLEHKERSRKVRDATAALNKAIGETKA